MKPTPGSITGTKIIQMQGGPPEWDGEVAGILKTAEGPMERWDHTADLAILYVKTDAYTTITLDHERKGGTVQQEHKVEVWTYAGYKEEWLSR